jgi:hypothetical protein
MTNVIEITDDELDTVLVALRSYQRGCGFDPDFQDEIDDLCEKINCGEVSPEIEAAPALLAACTAARDVPWVHNAGITNDIESLRRICLFYADWNNNTLAPALAKVTGKAVGA